MGKALFGGGSAFSLGRWAPLEGSEHFQHLSWMGPRELPEGVDRGEEMTEPRRGAETRGGVWGGRRRAGKYRIPSGMVGSLQAGLERECGLGHSE